MHVHSNYSLQMANFGAGLPKTQEISARRSAEVRKKLSLAAGALSEGGDEVYSIGARAEEHPESPKHQSADEKTDEEAFGRLFSAKA